MKDLMTRNSATTVPSCSQEILAGGGNSGIVLDGEKFRASVQSFSQGQN